MSKRDKTYQQRGKRLATDQKLKKISKASYRKPSVVGKDYHTRKAEAAIKVILKAKELNNFCGHFLVGSSSVLAFLKGHHSFRRAHSAIHTPMESKIIGASGEEAFLTTAKDITHVHPFAISREQPWLCASTDFLVHRLGKNEVVEVKTFSDAGNAAACYFHPPLRTLVQVWLAMECFGCDQGQLYVYILDQVSKRVTLFGVVHLERKASFFDRNLAVLSSLQYTRFLKEYFEHHGIFPTEKYLDTLAVRLSSRPIFSNNTKSLRGKESSRRPLDRAFPLACAYYDESVAGADPDHPNKLPFKELFRGFTWVRTSKKKRVIWLDEETRLEVFKDASAKLGKEDQQRFKEVLRQLEEFPSTAQFQTTHTSQKIERITAKHAKITEELLKNQLRILQEKYQLSIQRIKDLEAQVAHYAILVAKHSKAKKSAKNSKRRRTAKITKRQTTMQTLAKDSYLTETTGISKRGAKATTRLANERPNK